MQSKRPQLVVLTLLLFVIGCAPTPQFINHPRPDVTLDYAPFAAVGCTIAGQSEIACSASDDISRFCESVFRPDEVLGALNPPLPIVLCQFALYRDAGDDNVERPDAFLFQDGGLFPVAVRYLVLENNQVKILATPAGLRSTFAPIESPEEALAYAVASTSLTPRFGITYKSQYKYDVAQIEDTHVETTETGWRVNLYDHQLFGCGPHYEQEVTVDVSRTGEVTRSAAIYLYRNPDEDQMCVD